MTKCIRVLCCHQFLSLCATFIVLLHGSSCARTQWLKHQTDDFSPHATVVILPPDRKADWLLVDPRASYDDSVVVVHAINNRRVPEKKSTYRLLPGWHKVIYKESSLDPAAGMIEGLFDALDNVTGRTDPHNEWRHDYPGKGRSLRTVYTKRSVKLEPGKTYFFDGRDIREASGM
jgi:YD repeat-containing protein